MLDLKLIREDTAFVRDRLRRRGKPELDAVVDELLALDERRRALITDVDALRARRNDVSPQVGRLKQAGQHAEAEPLILQMRELSERMTTLEKDREQVDSEVRSRLLNLPNLPEAQVPAGGEESNQVLREWGAAPVQAFAPLPHWELGERLGILDLPRGTKIAGSGFPLYVGLGARLERALINLMLDLHVREHDYTELAPPLLVNETAALGTGQLPKYADDMYFVTEDRLYLIPTAEVPVTNLHAGELLDHEALPKRYVAYTPCFRREAGSHGKDTRGILRVHQSATGRLRKYRGRICTRASCSITRHCRSGTSHTRRAFGVKPVPTAKTRAAFCAYINSTKSS